MKYLASHSILTFLSALLAVTMPFLCHAEPESKVRLKTVVLDPGHGGHDAGCVSKDGKTYEKNLTLSIARQVGNKIKAAYPDVKVIYTRTTDKFIPLNERAEIANRNKADLFISIHINAVDSSSPTGTSAHVLGPSSNKNRDTFSESMELCRRENSVILLEDDYSTAYQGFNPNDPESYIIFNLLQNAHLQQSLQLATLVQERMGEGPIKKNRGISRDPFLVLVRTAMPSVLLELGFISNSSDLSVLRSKSGQDKLAQNVFDAFSEYKEYYDESGIIENTPTQDGVSAGSGVSADSGGDDGSVRYGVQVFVLSRKLRAGDPAFKGISCDSYKSGKNYKYVAGDCSSIAEARSFLRKVRQKFPDAYVVKIENGTVAPAK